MEAVVHTKASERMRHSCAKTTCCLLIIWLVFFVGCEKITKEPLSIGDPAPQFETVAMDGSMVSLSEAKGFPFILRFFDPHCKYCKADTVAFNEFYLKYKNKGARVVYLNTEPDPKDAQKFVDDLQIPFPVVLDSEKKVADLFHVQVVPQTIFLDPNHKIIGAILGGVSMEELEELLGPFL